MSTSSSCRKLQSTLCSWLRQLAASRQLPSFRSGSMNLLYSHNDYMKYLIRMTSIATKTEPITHREYGIIGRSPNENFGVLHKSQVCYTCNDTVLSTVYH
jgi:hypothetical protein